MNCYQADWIVPIAGPPIQNGWIAVDAGRIVSLGSPARDTPTDVTTLRSRAILPGLANAHTHLELSHLHGQVPPSDSFNDWVTALMSLRRASGLEPTAPAILDAAARAIAAARASGTGLLGDISNTLATVPLLRDAAMPAHVFHELTGFNLPEVAGRIQRARSSIDAAEASGGGVHVTMAPHAPYSVSPALFRAIRQDVDAHEPPITSVHLGESSPELELVRAGTGITRVMLEKLGAWTDEWRPHGGSPVDYLMDLAFLDARTLVVHGVQFTARDLERLVSCGATLVSCPRSNRYVGVGSPPLQAFYESGVRVAFGTDSLASTTDLNLFAELAEARRIAPAVAPARLLASATLEGARALGRDTEFGSLAAGKRAQLLAVAIPDGITDVEEYLVSGLEPGRLEWLDTD